MYDLDDDVSDGGGGSVCRHKPLPRSHCVYLTVSAI